MNGAPHSIGDAGLRMALRGLRRDADPGSDLWPGIAARIASMPVQAQPAQPASRQRWLWPLATAASLLVAVGVTWKLQPTAPSTSGASIATTVPAPAKRAPLVQREAEAMTVQYRAALREIDPASIPVGWQAGLDALDRSAAEIRGALQRDPTSRLLLERLRDTYTRRLALSRRALYA